MKIMKNTVKRIFSFAMALVLLAPLVMICVYASLEKEVSELEKTQYQLIEDNKKLVSEIGVLSSSERIEQIANGNR